MYVKLYCISCSILCSINAEGPKSDMAEAQRTFRKQTSVECVDSTSKAALSYIRPFYQRIPNVDEISPSTSALDAFIRKLKPGEQIPRCSPDCKHEYCRIAFYTKANRQYSFGDRMEVCPLCLRISKNSKKSHIFPECLLKQYNDIHGTLDSDKNFILDPSRGFTDTDSMCHFMFCKKCEKAGSAEEQYLLNAYLKIMGSEGDTYISVEDSHKLRHILAVILFRGALLAINFEDKKSKESLISFLELRDYCSKKKIGDYRKTDTAGKVHVFVLHNIPFSQPPPDVPESPILDFQLRNPALTELINTEFMYTKFDCFHVIFECGPSYNYPSCFSGDPVEDHFDLPSPQDAMNIFPKFLLKHNMDQIPHIASKLVGASQICAILQIFRMKSAGGEYECAKAETKRQCHVKKDRGIILSKTDLNPEERSKLVNVARMKSPLVNSRIEGRNTKFMKALKYKNEKLQNENQELKQKLLLHEQDPMANSGSLEYVNPIQETKIDV